MYEHSSKADVSTGLAATYLFHHGGPVGFVHQPKQPTTRSERGEHEYDPHQAVRGVSVG